MIELQCRILMSDNDETSNGRLWTIRSLYSKTYAKANEDKDFGFAG